MISVWYLTETPFSSRFSPVRGNNFSPPRGKQLIKDLFRRDDGLWSSEELLQHMMFLINISLSTCRWEPTSRPEHVSCEDQGETCANAVTPVKLNRCNSDIPLGRRRELFPLCLEMKTKSKACGVRSNSSGKYPRSKHFLSGLINSESVVVHLCSALYYGTRQMNLCLLSGLKDHLQHNLWKEQVQCKQTLYEKIWGPLQTSQRT